MGVQTLAVAALVGGLASAGATVMQGRAENQAAKYNARMAEAAAADKMRQASSDQVVQARDRRKFMAAQIADIAGLGGQIGSGTSLAFAEAAGRDAELDRLNIAGQAQNEAQSLRNSARLTRWEGRQAQTQGLIGGFGQAIGSYAKWKTT